MSKASAYIALAAAAALVLWFFLGPVRPGEDLPPLLLVVGVLQLIMAPLSVIGVGLGAAGLIRQPEGDRLSVIGVLGNAAYLFLLSISLAF